MVIDVPEDLCPIIDGAPFATAPSAEELHALLGPPSQITEPDVRAPVGHRNNRWHVYDTDGVFFYEHHYTRRINGCSIVLQSDEVLVPCVPQQPFSGLLRLGGLAGRERAVRGLIDTGDIHAGLGFRGAYLLR